MRYLLLFVVFLINISQVSANHKNLTGKVVSVKNEPVIGAVVAIKELKKQTLTDVNGEFNFFDLAYGNYTIEVSSMEFKPLTLKVNYNKPYQKFDIKITENSEIALSQVTVLHVSEKKEIESKGFAVNVIETEKVALQNVQTNELLDRVAGVRIRQDGGLGSQVNYNINGLSGNAVKIFIDGVPTSNYGASFSLNSIPPALIERIEVYKGVVPAHLSEDALGGAINVVLKKSIKNSLSTSYSIGSFNTHQWNMNGTYKHDKTGLIFRGSGFYNYSDNSYEVWGKNIRFVDYLGNVDEGKRVKRFHDDYKSYGGKLDIGVTNKKWADQFFVGLLASDQMKEIQNGVSMAMVFGDRHTRQNSQVATLNYSKKDLLIKGLSLSLNSSFSNLVRNTIDTVGNMYDWSGKPILDQNGNPKKYASGAESASFKSFSENHDQTFVVRSNLSYQIAKGNTLHANLLYNSFNRGVDDFMLSDSWRAFVNTRDSKKKIYSLTYENLAFDDKLRTNIFFKHYVQDITSNEPLLASGVYSISQYKKSTSNNGYGIALSYQLVPNVFILSSAERAYRLPTENELFGNDADQVLSSYQLSPEKSDNLNLGFNLGPFKVDRHSFGLNTNLFLRDVEGLIRQMPMNTNRDVSRYENVRSVLGRGIDAEFTYRYNRVIQFNFNVSKFNLLFNTEFKDDGSRYNYYRKQIRNEPSFKFSSGLTYFAKDILQEESNTSFYYHVNYVERFLRDWADLGGTGLNWIPTQFSNDIGITHTFPSRKFVLGLDAKNIFDQQIFDNFGLQKAGRAFYAKLSYIIR